MIIIRKEIHNLIYLEDATTNKRIATVFPHNPKDFEIISQILACAIEAHNNTSNHKVCLGVGWLVDGPKVPCVKPDSSV